MVKMISLRTASEINYRRLFFLLLVLSCFSITAQEQRNLLQKELQDQANFTGSTFQLETFKVEDIKSNLCNLPVKVKEGIIEKGKEALKYNWPWPAIPATSYLEFVRSGDRMQMEDYYKKRNDVLKSLILAELLEDQNHYVDAIINASWTLCEQSSWVLAAHLSLQKAGDGLPDIQEPILDLGAGEIAASLGWAYNLFGTKFENVSPLLKKRIAFEITTRIIQPYIQRDDFWWMGFEEHPFVNNWNPWINYNVLLSASLLGDALEKEFSHQVVAKTMKSVDNFINYYKNDGASEEGPNYWSHAGGKLLEYLELLKKISDGEIDLATEQIIQNIGKYIIDAHIAGKYYVNFADSSVRVRPDPGIIYRYGVYIDALELLDFASFTAEQSDFYKHPLRGSLDNALHNLMLYPKIAERPGKKINKLLAWYPDTEIIMARTSTDPKEGFFFAAKGGHNDESHNHNDAGSFILYHQGEPLIVDVGVETYSAKTFSKDRYEIWTMQSDYHNLPKINNTSQAYGRKYAAKDVSLENTDSAFKFSLDICAAYPKNAQCEYWKRTFIVSKGKPELNIEDKVKYREKSTPSIQYFILASPPKLVEEGKVLLKQSDGEQVVLKYASAKFKYEAEEIILKDKKLRKDWLKDTLYRVAIISKEVTALDEMYKFTVMVENQ